MGAKAQDLDSRAADSFSGAPPRRSEFRVKSRALVASALAVILMSPWTVPPPAEAHGRKGSKKFCKHHTKKCRRNVKNPIGHTKVTYRLRTKSGTKTWSMTVGGGVTYSETPGQEGGNRCLNTGEGEFWVCNGGVGRKKGTAVLHSISWAIGNLFNNTFYRLHHKTTWRWKKRRIKEVSEGWWPEVVSWYWKDAGKTGGTLGKPWYRFFRGVPRSGHRRHIGWNMESCMLGFAVCVQFHPYVRHYVHGNGTFHASGHNW